MKIYITAILSAFLILISCSKETSPFTDTPILESYLLPGTNPIVKIRRQIPFSSSVSYSSDDIKDLQVRLSFGSNSHLLSIQGDSCYTDKTLVIDEGMQYNLSFSFNSKNVSAYTEVPLKPVNFRQSATSISVVRMDGTFGPPLGGFEMPEPVELTWTNSDTSYFLLVIENMETTLDPVRSFEGMTPPGNMFRERPTTASGISIRPQEFQYFGRHRLILYHVLPDYASLYDNKISSSQNLTNPSTSIVNGYGIFTGLNADTLYLRVVEAEKK
jgi:hypothetical protein